MDCFISTAEQRLADAASFWLRAHKCYFDPDEFRRNVQASIQAFRSVTWLLQKEKDAIPGFEPWYSKRQEVMRVDKRLRWLVIARNRIEKQGNLLTKSKFVVEYISGLSPSKKQVLDLPPSTRPKNIAKAIAATYPAAARTDGAVLKLSREWIDSELPEEELLSLLVYSYSCLHELLIEAHQLFDLEQRDSCRFYRRCTRSNDRLPKQMSSFQFPATAWFSLVQGKLKEYEHITKTISEALIKKISKKALGRYDLHGLDSQPSTGSSFSKHCDHFFKIGKEMLKADGFHFMSALVQSKSGFNIFQLRPDDRADQHVMMNELSSCCARLRAVSCILIAESWVAKPSTEHGPFAVNYPDRREALTLDGFHKDEGFQSRLAIFARDLEQIIFSESKDNVITTRGFGPSGFSLVADAIKKVWKV